MKPIRIAAALSLVLAAATACAAGTPPAADPALRAASLNAVAATWGNEVVAPRIARIDPVDVDGARVWIRWTDRRTGQLRTEDYLAERRDGRWVVQSSYWYCRPGWSHAKHRWMCS